MAGVSIVFVTLVLFALFLGFLFLVGTIFLIVGLGRRYNPKNAGKKSPIVCIVLGVIFLVPPLGISFLIAIDIVWVFNFYPSKISMCEEAIEELLDSADAGDRDSFEKMFTPRLQEREDFQTAVDAFFRIYPNGLSLCEREVRYNPTSGSLSDDESDQIANVCCICFLDREWYYMELSICFENAESPEDVGVMFFCIENLEANAIDREYGADEFLVCEIGDENEISARLIDGRGYLYTPTPDRSITVDEMKAFLEQYDDNFNGLVDCIGEPNAWEYGDNFINSCYYELVPEDGKPRYVYISADSDSGYFYDTYLCSAHGKIEDIR